MAQPAKDKPLTAFTIEHLKPARDGKPYRVWDRGTGGLPGLHVVVGKKAKTFVVGGWLWAEKPVYVWHKLERCDVITLQDARDQAREVNKALKQGRHPREAKAEAREQEAAKRREKSKVAANTIGAALETYITARRKDGLRSWGDIESRLRRDFIGQERNDQPDGEPWVDGPDPLWRDTPVTTITRGIVKTRLDTIKAKRGLHAARHALMVIRPFFNNLVDSEDIEISPCAGMKDKILMIKVERDLERQRWFTDDAELRDVWDAAAALAYPHGRVVQLLMLSGQRLNDIACAARPEIDLTNKRLTVPGKRYKNGHPHEVPLTPRMIAILEGLPSFTGNYLFTTTAGEKPVSSFKNAKKRIDDAIAARRKAEGRDPMEPWVLHDIRRSVRSRLTDSDDSEDAKPPITDSFIAERVIGHALPGMQRKYDVGSHRQQKRKALEEWETALLKIVEPKPPSGGKVVLLNASKRRRA